jgi:hypothetical protein
VVKLRGQRFCNFYNILHILHFVVTVNMNVICYSCKTTVSEEGRDILHYQKYLQYKLFRFIIFYMLQLKSHISLQKCNAPQEENNDVALRYSKIKCNTAAVMNVM